MKKWEKKHRELEDKYDHYVCGRCMEIGAKEVIKEFVDDLNDLPINASHLETYDDRIQELTEKWEDKL